MRVIFAAIGVGTCHGTIRIGSSLLGRAIGLDIRQFVRNIHLSRRVFFATSLCFQEVTRGTAIAAYNRGVVRASSFMRGIVSLGIAFKGPEGIVLAADSRATLTSQIQTPQGQVFLPATFDNATKLLKVNGQENVGAITYGAGAIGQQEPRTPHSFMPEFEATLPAGQRQSVQDFAQRLSQFFLDRWTEARMPNPVQPGQDMVFLVAGYDEGAPYGRVFEVFVPSRPNPREAIPSGQFGAVWGGQNHIATRLLNGFDPTAMQVVRTFFGVQAPQGQPDPLEAELKTQLSAKIPWAFLPLQDCVDLSIFMLRATITLQKWTVDVRGVGGAIDVATITRTEGFKYVQQKQIVGEIR